MATAWAALWLTGCGDTTSSRVSDDNAAATTRFGEDDRVEVTIVPGRAQQALDTDGGFIVELRAAGPFPVVTIDNGSVDDQRLVVGLENVDPSWSFVPRVVALPDDRRQDPRCSRDGASAVVIAAPTTPATVDGELRAVFTLDIPRCARTTLSALPPPDAEALEILVVGPIDGDRGYLDAAVRIANSRETDFVHFLGRIAFGDETDPFAAFSHAVGQLSVPFGVTLARADARINAAAFTSAFGPTSFATALGAVRYLELDTSSAELSEGQFALVEAVEVRRPAGILFHEWPLVDRDPSSGTRSSHQSRRMLSLLAERGFETLVSGSGIGVRRERYGTFSLIEVGRLRSDQRQGLVVEVRRPWPALQACSDSADCGTGGRCDRGFCRTRCDRDSDCETPTECASSGFCRLPCERAADCPEPLPECEVDGWCAEDPEISVTTLSF